MRYGFLISAALVALIAAAPASFAFEIKSAPINPDGSAQFSDPDNLTDSMASHMSDGNAATLHFGSTSLSFGASRSGGDDAMSPALQQRLMVGPGGLTDPNDGR